MINLKILRNIIKNNPLKKEKTISEQILNNKNNIIYPDSDLINVIDTPHIVLNDKNNISFINNATKKNFNINIKNNIFHVFRRPEFRENIKNILIHYFKKVARSERTTVRAIMEKEGYFELAKHIEDI